MLHNVLIAAHAVCGLAAFALGVAVRRPCPSGVSALFWGYLGALWLMAALVVAAVAVDWGALAAPSRVLFGALAVFALYIGWRGWRALQELRRPATDPAAYIEDVGFTLIALFDGFAVVGALDLGAPPWLVLAVGALGVFVGRLGVGRVKARAAG